MQITISDKIIAEAIGNMLDGQIYENYDSGLIKAAGIAKKADMIKAVMADKKFMATLARLLTCCAEDPDQITDFAYDSSSKIIDRAVKACEDAYDKFDEERAIRQEAEDLKRSIRVLEAAGFKVTKSA